MAINFKNINLEVIDLVTNASPDIYINLSGITFSRRVLEDLNYASNVQYCLDATNKVFAVRVCKPNDPKSTSFSRPRAEQTYTLACSNKNLREAIVALISDYNPKKRYKITGEFDAENRIIYYDMATATVSTHQSCKEK